MSKKTSIGQSRRASSTHARKRNSTYRRPGVALIRKAVKESSQAAVAKELGVYAGHIYNALQPERGVSLPLYQAMVEKGWLKRRSRLCVDMSPAERDAFRRMVAEEGKTARQFLLDLVSAWEWDNLVYDDDEYERKQREQQY